MNKTALVIVIGLVILVGGYFLLNGSYQEPAAPAPLPQQQTGGATPPQIAAPSGLVISMSAANFSFNPKTLNAKVGEKVVLDITAAGQHTFTISELGINTVLFNGKTTRVEFTPLKSGTFTYFCSIPGHREAGQVGTLKVE